MSVVEWGDKFPGAMPQDYLQVDFELLDSEARSLRVTSYGAQSEHSLAAWGAGAATQD